MWGIELGFLGDILGTMWGIELGFLGDILGTMWDNRTRVHGR